MPLLDDTLMVLSGVHILVWRRYLNHIVIYLFLIAYWMLGSLIQDITFDNSIPYPNMAMALAVGFAVTHLSVKHRIIWPLWISIFMVLSATNDLWYVIYKEVINESGIVRATYQNTTYLLFFLSLAVLSHPRLRKRHERERWAYS